MVSNLKGNLYEIVKRRLMALSHYRFRMKLHQMKIKYNNNIIETNEYMTSKRCCNCSNIKKDLTKEKVYKCDLCKLEIDRDINASINIYHE
jgi:putative transposase